jgi:hypothetical protein
VRLVGSIFVIILAGCAGAGSSLPGARLPTKPWLVGFWVPAGEHCDSDAGVRFGADGTWSVFDEEGSWHLDGNRLISLTTRRGEPGAAEEKVTPIERNEARVEILGADRYISHRANGEVMELRRCPKSTS